LNRFDGVVVFNPLGKDDLLKVAKLMLLDLAANLKKKGITLEITSAAIEKLASDGYEPAFGARPMRRIINVVLGDLFGKAILSGEIASGDKVRLSVVEEVGRSSFAIEKVVS
jgi:ATP-dependent Clp protease ATP-binding subunit ClpB